MTLHTALVERLRSVGSPYALLDWDARDGHYVSACRLTAADVPGLIDIVKCWNDIDSGYDKILLETARDGAELLPVTAWRALGDLRSEKAVKPLVEILAESEDEFDDWALNDLPHVFGKIGEAAIEPLVRLAKRTDVTDNVRSLAVRGLRCVVDNHETTRDRVVAHLTEMLSGAAAGQEMFNSGLLVELVELQATEAAESIERAFAGDLLDVGMMGDWEEVRSELGVEGLGLEMPANPHNSIRDLQMGVGIFSDEPIVSIGEIDQEAEQAYYEQAHRAFSESTEGRKVLDRHSGLSWFRLLMEFGLNYRVETVDVISVESVDDFLFEYLPSKVVTPPDAASAIVYELTKFWEFLNRVYELPDAHLIVDWLNSDGLVDDVEEALSDNGIYGTGKSMFMWGQHAGYDMTTQAGLDECMMAYNESLRSADTPPISAESSPIVRSHRVGRNDPCPCGSGKKYKKCCRKNIAEH